MFMVHVQVPCTLSSWNSENSLTITWPLSLSSFFFAPLTGRVLLTLFFFFFSPSLSRCWFYGSNVFFSTIDFLSLFSLSFTKIYTPTVSYNVWPKHWTCHRFHNVRVRKDWKLCWCLRVSAPCSQTNRLSTILIGLLVLKMCVCSGEIQLSKASCAGGTCKWLYIKQQKE